MEDKQERRKTVGSVADVAKHFGVTYQTVKGWRVSGMPGEPGVWDLDEIKAWRTEVSLVKVEGMDEAKLKAAISDARKKEADARIKEIQAEKAENVGLVELDEVEEFLSTFLAGIRNVFKSLPVKTRRFGLDVSKAVEKEVDLCLHASHKLAQKLNELRRD